MGGGERKSSELCDAADAIQEMVEVVKNHAELRSTENENPTIREDYSVLRDKSNGRIGISRNFVDDENTKVDLPYFSHIKDGERHECIGLMISQGSIGVRGKLCLTKDSAMLETGARIIVVGESETTAVKFGDEKV